jgi:putative N-acetylmannosamine-6-phosphate epimerase
MENVNVPIVSAGSINSMERLQDTIDQGVWGFTIGGAFFEKKFVPGGSFRENVIAVLDKLK